MRANRNHGDGAARNMLLHTLKMVSGQGNRAAGARQQDFGHRAAQHIARHGRQHDEAADARGDGREQADQVEVADDLATRRAGGSLCLTPPRTFSAGEKCRHALESR